MERVGWARRKRGVCPQLRGSAPPFPDQKKKKKSEKSHTLGGAKTNWFPRGELFRAFNRQICRGRWPRTDKGRGSNAGSGETRAGLEGGACRPAFPPSFLPLIHSSLNGPGALTSPSAGGPGCVPRAGGRAGA